MSLEVSITKLSQDLNLSNGETENFLILELPNGSTIRARVNEAAAQAVTGCFINGSNAAQQVHQEDDVTPPTSNGFHEVTTPDGHQALEFGGSPTPTVRTRPKFVGVDDKGNPILTGHNNSHDPGEISAGADEDGVGQV